MHRSILLMSLSLLISTAMAETPKKSAYKDGFTVSESDDFKLTLGGRIKADGWYDVNGYQKNSIYGLDAAAIPLVGTNDINAHKKGNFNYSLTGSQLYADVHKKFFQRDLRGYLEIDFAGNNSPTSNSYSPRIRHAYVEGCGWLVGQTWYTFSDENAFINTFDNLYGTGRQVTIRYTHNFSNHWSLAAGLDRPNTQIYQFAVDSSTGETDPTYTGFFDNGDSNGAAKSQYPDAALKLKYTFDSGYICLRGVLRDLQVSIKMDDNDSLKSYKKSRMGWGVGISSNYQFCHYFTFLIQGNFGEGIGRYIDDLDNSNTFDSVFVYPTTPSAESDESYRPHYKLVKAWNIMGGFTWNFTDKIFSNLGASYTRLKKPGGLGDLQAVDFQRSLQRYTWNVGYKLLPNTTTGLEVMHYRRKSGIPEGFHGKDTRILASLIYVI